MCPGGDIPASPDLSSLLSTSSKGLPGEEGTDRKAVVLSLSIRTRWRACRVHPRDLDQHQCPASGTGSQVMPTLLAQGPLFENQWF